MGCFAAVVTHLAYVEQAVGGARLIRGDVYIIRPRSVISFLLARQMAQSSFDDDLARNSPLHGVSLELTMPFAHGAAMIGGHMLLTVRIRTCTDEFRSQQEK